MSYSIENADRLRWQMRAHIHLAVFLDAAAKQGLPAIAWTIATTGAITGTVNGLGVTAAEQPRRDGSSSLYARFESDGEPLGAIRAALVPPMNDEAGA